MTEPQRPLIEPDAALTAALTSLSDAALTEPDAALTEPRSADRASATASRHSAGETRSASESSVFPRVGHVRRRATIEAVTWAFADLRVWQTLKGRQRDEGGEEARVMTCVSGQDPSDCGKTGGNTQSRFFFCMYPEDVERIR